MTRSRAVLKLPRCLSKYLFLSLVVRTLLLTHYIQNLLVLFAEAKIQQANIVHTTATLSQARYALAATSSDELVFFGGGEIDPGIPTARVDICNATSGTWTTATLSVARWDLAAASSGDLVFFGGGTNSTNASTVYDTVDIYNKTNDIWSNATLSQARYALAATSVGTLILFGGGAYRSQSLGSIIFSNVVDIYNVTNNTWATATLSAARYYLTATSLVNRYAFFAGGSIGTYFATVDIYDSFFGTWNTSTLSQKRTNVEATSLSNSAFFGGGYISSSIVSNVVDIFNLTSQKWSTATLSQARTYFAAASAQDIVAFGGGYQYSVYFDIVDMYNVTSDIWFTVNLSQPRYLLAATSSTNKIFFAGGYSYQSLDTIDIYCLDSNCVQAPTFTGTPLSQPSTPSANSQAPSITFSTNWNPFSFIPSTNYYSSVTSTFVSLPPAAIGGIVAGVVALFVCLGVVSLLIIILKRKKKKRRKLSFQHHNIGNDESSVSKNDIDLDLTSVVTARKSRIHFQELVVEREIGVGSYGKVWLGKWNHAPVALKFCKERNGINDIFSEIKVLLELPPHPNVVQMYGISCNSAQLVIVLEYCAGGSLDKLLFENDNLMQDNDMIALVKGIATGILHLHKHNIIHRDLAARNVLLTASGEPKISDFGMSRIIERAEGRTNSQVGPIRWMAPESLSNKIYSKKSDIWMLGIVVYEIVARAEPHVDVDPVDVGVLIRDQGLTPEIPSHTPPVLREIMQSCWKQNPDDRPNIEQVCSLLTKET